MKIIIVDDSITFRNDLRYFLEKKKDYKIINEASDGAEFLLLSNIHEADIILMDINMPDINGIQATKKILWKNHNLKILAITMYKEAAYLIELIGAGIKGCVFKNEIFDKLHEAIETIMKGEYYFPDNIKLDDKKRINLLKE